MIRTLIAEPVTLTREGLVALLGRESDIELATADGTQGHSRFPVLEQERNNQTT